MTLESDLEGAVQRGEIHVRYQPQIDAVSGRIVAVEALSRWRHPKRGIVPPSTFIPLAEKSKTIHEIGRFMMDAGCRRAASWAEKGFSVEVGINVSALQLTVEPFFGHIRRLLNELSLSPRRLTIEVTETTLVENLEDAAAQLGALRDIGVGISIDDFGATPASLAHLVALPATELKLDQSLVQDDNAQTGNLLEAVVRLVQQRGIRVVAEGVETKLQLDRMNALGINRAQGFFIGRPEPAEVIESLLAAQG